MTSFLAQKAVFLAKCVEKDPFGPKRRLFWPNMTSSVQIRHNMTKKIFQKVQPIKLNNFFSNIFGFKGIHDGQN